MRLTLSNHSFNEVLSFYDQKISDWFKGINIYPEHFFVMRHLADDSHLAYLGDLPIVTPEEMTRFNKSKLEIKNQWASHPSTEE